MLQITKLMSIGESITRRHSVSDEELTTAFQESTESILEEHTRFIGIADGAAMVANHHSLIESVQYEVLQESIISTIFKGLSNLIKKIIDAIKNIIEKIKGNNAKFNAPDSDLWVKAERKAKTVSKDKTFKVSVPEQFYDTKCLFNAIDVANSLSDIAKDIVDIHNGSFNNMIKAFKGASDQAAETINDKYIDKIDPLLAKFVDADSDELFSIVVNDYISKKSPWLEGVRTKDELKQKIHNQLEGEKQDKEFNVHSFSDTDLWKNCVNLKDKYYKMTTDKIQQVYENTLAILNKFYNTTTKLERENFNKAESSSKFIQKYASAYSRFLSTAISVTNVAASSTITAMNNFLRYANYILNTYIATVGIKKSDKDDNKNTEAKEPEKK